MRLHKTPVCLVVLLMAGMLSCKQKTDKIATVGPLLIKGLYSVEPGVKTFHACGKTADFWVADSSAQLELKYSQLVSFEKPGQAVYIEVEGTKIKSATAGYDSTLVVKKIINITKDIPANCK